MCKITVELSAGEFSLWRRRREIIASQARMTAGRRDSEAPTDTRSGLPSES